MSDPILLFSTLFGAGVLYLVACATLVKAGTTSAQSSLWAKTAAVLCACFAFLIASCAALRPIGDAASACASIVICILSLAVTTAFMHRWRRHAAYEIGRTEHIDKLLGERRALEQEAKALPSLCAKAARAHNLTRKEEVVLLFILQGKTQGGISHELVLSINTIKSHVRNIYRKTGVHSKQELANVVFEKPSPRSEGARATNREPVHEPEPSKGMFGSKAVAGECPDSEIAN